MGKPPDSTCAPCLLLRNSTGPKRVRCPSARAFAPALTLLAASFLINYVDRGNLGVAAPLLKGELHISGSQLGLLLAAFFWTYTRLQFVVGWAIDRFEVSRVLATGFLLWSLATVATGLVGGFVSLLLVRLVLGIGESVAIPCYSKILACYLPEHYRGFGNAVIGAGQYCGPAVGTFGAGLLMARYGWRPVFVAIGLVSLLWLPAWQKWMPRGEGVCGPVLRFISLVLLWLELVWASHIRESARLLRPLAVRNLREDGWGCRTGLGTSGTSCRRHLPASCWIVLATSSQHS